MVAPVDRALEKLGIVAQRRGGRWWAENCPLPTHGQPNPEHRWQNFFVRDNRSPRPGQFHCFSCKSGGTLVELVMAMRDVEFADAADWLRTLGEQAPPPVLSVRFDPTGPRVFRMPVGVEFTPLEEWNSVPRSYLEGRGVDSQQVKGWGIGYALEGRLAGRIVIPIRDQRGRLANYAARTFVGDETRYLAAQSSERPDKSALWGEEFWKEPGYLLTGRDVVVVFEGALNGLAIERALRSWNSSSRPSLAGLQGSELDHRRLAKLGTFRTIVCATDPDRAGDRAAREIAAALGRRADVRRARYPDERDAADLQRWELEKMLAETTSHQWE